MRNNKQKHCQIRMKLTTQMKNKTMTNHMKGKNDEQNNNKIKKR